MSKLSSQGAKWDATRLYVLNRDGWICAYCAKHLEGKDATADHIIPKAAGGTDDAWNLVAACVSCNGRKSDHVIERLLWLNTALFKDYR
jgi:5-methylcytosine-specific restriction endonuclease McrA